MKEPAFERREKQGHHCTWREQGIRCSLCSRGPCRITAKAPRGVCGIGADGKEPVKIDVLVLAMACGSGPGHMDQKATIDAMACRSHGQGPDREGQKQAAAMFRSFPAQSRRSSADSTFTASPGPLRPEAQRGQRHRGHIRSSAESTFAHDRRIPSTAAAGGSTTTAAP